MSHILLTYHVEILDLLTVTNYIRQNCELFRKSFMYSGIAIWNSLPIHVKNATSVNTFNYYYYYYYYYYYFYNYYYYYYYCYCYYYYYY